MGVSVEDLELLPILDGIYHQIQKEKRDQESQQRAGQNSVLGRRGRWQSHR